MENTAFSFMIDSMQTALGAQLPAIAGALAILAIGWLLAVILRAAVRRLLRTARVDERLLQSTGQSVALEAAVGAAIFWLVVVLTLIAMFNALDLHTVSEPFAQMMDHVMGYLPNVVAGLFLSLLAWTAATLLHAVSNRVLKATSLDERLSAEAGMEPMSRNVANVLFWIVILLFLPAILAAFQLQGLLSPVQSMVDKGLMMVPNLFAGGVLGLVGWVVAKVLRALVTNLLAATGADELGGQLGMDSSIRLSKLAGTLVFILVFVPALIAALDALQISAISQPATDMLNEVFSIVPDLVAAAVILFVTWHVAGFASRLVSQLLSGVGFDLLPERLGFGHVVKSEPTPSAIVGRVVQFFAMLFAVVEASERLGFVQVSELVTTFIEFGSDVLLGCVILVIGVWLANLAYNTVTRASGDEHSLMAKIARLAILGLVTAMGLRAMGIASDIVNLAFGLTLGAIAVALALAFGLGGREAAGRQMEWWFARLRGEIEKDEADQRAGQAADRSSQD